MGAADEAAADFKGETLTRYQLPTV
jgi:hypothetical protein